MRQHVECNQRVRVRRRIERGISISRVATFVNDLEIGKAQRDSQEMDKADVSVSGRTWESAN